MSVSWNRRRVSAFADEIGDALEQQLAVLAANDVGNIELRGVWGKGVLELSAAEVRRVKDAARQAGVGFSAVGSPIGKFPVAGDFGEERERMRRALEYAAVLEAPFVRIFSYFIPAGDDAAAYRSQVLDWLGALAELAEPTGIVLAHENERGIYGDTGAPRARLVGEHPVARLHRHIRLCQLRGVRGGSLPVLAVGAPVHHLLPHQGRGCGNQNRSPGRGG